MSSRRKALVLGSDTGSFLGVIRSLGRRGIDVHIAWCPTDAPAAHSRYVRQAHRLARPSGDDGWIDEFAGLMERERFDLVLPTNDPTLIPLQLARQRLESLGRLYLLGDRAFGITFDKIRTRELAVANRVPVAPGEVIHDVDGVAAALDGRPYPLVIKPQSSFNVDDLEQRNSVTRAYTEADAELAIGELLARGHVLVEENVTGAGWGVEVLAHDGEVLLSQQHQRLHEPLQGGGSTYRRTVPRDPGLMEAVSRLVSDLHYTGVAMFEFKGDPVSGRWILVEINGRFWGSLPLSLAAGIDFPYALWQLLVEGRVDLTNGYRPYVYCRNVKRDLKWQWVNLRADRSDPVLATAPLRQVAGELGHIVRGREHTDQFTADDLSPGVVEFRQLGVSLADRVRAWAAARPPVRRRRARRARQALAASRTVLFVCYGNICRSPFAAAAARRSLAPGVEVISAGTADDGGRRSPAVARRVAAEFGLSLEEHRSRPVTAELVDRADAIFVFDEQNWGDMRRRYPRASGKLHLIGMLGDGPLIVADPINGGDEEFRRAYRALVDALDTGRLT